MIIVKNLWSVAGMGFYKMNWLQPVQQQRPALFFLLLMNYYYWVLLCLLISIELFAKPWYKIEFFVIENTPSMLGKMRGEMEAAPQ